jgi:hypothetical protein
LTLKTRMIYDLGMASEGENARVEASPQISSERAASQGYTRFLKRIKELRVKAPQFADGELAKMKERRENEPPLSPNAILNADAFALNGLCTALAFSSPDLLSKTLDTGQHVINIEGSKALRFPQDIRLVLRPSKREDVESVWIIASITAGETRVGNMVANFSLSRETPSVVGAENDRLGVNKSAGWLLLMEEAITEVAGQIRNLT